MGFQLDQTWCQAGKIFVRVVDMEYAGVYLFSSCIRFVRQIQVDSCATVDSFGREPGGDSRKSNDPGESDDSDDSGDPDIQIKRTRDRVRALVQLENRDAFIISR
jgi:hypothetical protein